MAVLFLADRSFERNRFLRNLQNLPNTLNRHIQLFGESHLEETALQYNLRILDRLPIDPQLARACDQGTLELYGGDLLKNAVEAVEKV